MKYKDLTDTQKEAFAEKFYSLADIDDTDSPSPWGCPWYWCENDEVLSADMGIAAMLFHEQVKKELLDMINILKTYKNGEHD